MTGTMTSTNIWFGSSRRERGRRQCNDAVLANGRLGVVLDGAANAYGVPSQRLVPIIRQLYGKIPLTTIIRQLDTVCTGHGVESTIVAAVVEDGWLSGFSCGDSVCAIVRDGKLSVVTSVSKPRLGTGHPDVQAFSVPVRRYDTVCLYSDGLCLPHWKIASVVVHHMLRPDSLPHVLLDAEKSFEDDVSVLTFCVRL